MKRMFLFLLTNMLVISTLMIIARLFGVDQYVNQYGLNYTSLFLYCCVWGFGGSFISLLMSKTMAKMFMRVKVVDEDPAYSALVSKVHALAREAGLKKMPEVGVYQSPEVNAFATGPSKSNSIVAVSSGLLSGMRQNEVDAVLAHEVSHIANGDMVTMTLLQGVVNTFAYFFAKIITFAIGQAMRGEDDRRPNGFLLFGIELVLVNLFAFLGGFVVAYFSRYREYRADAGAAKINGAQNMIAALERLKGSTDMIDNTRGELAAFKISGKGGFWALLSTHPPLDDRIEALRSSRFA